MKHRPVLLIVLWCIANSCGAGLKYRNGREIFKLKNAHCFIANPRYLCNGNEAYDTSNAMFKVIAGEIDTALKKNQAADWSPVSVEMSRKMTIGFNQMANRKTGFVDSLPYTAWEYCVENKIDTFIAFYLYKENPYKDIREGNIVTIEFPVPGLYQSLTMFTLRIPIDLSNVQLCLAVYDVPSNTCLFFKRTDDEDYISLKELVDELFQKL